jgi:HEPN domain-containing protein
VKDQAAACETALLELDEAGAFTPNAAPDTPASWERFKPHLKLPALVADEPRRGPNGRYFGRAELTYAGHQEALAKRPLLKCIGQASEGCIIETRMATREQLKELAALRLQEAEALLEAGLYDGAAYLCGYVVELALKARICRLLDENEYPDTGRLKQVYGVHDLDQLLLLSGLRRKLGLANKAVFDNWSIAVPWKPERRYAAVGSVKRQEAEEILQAVNDRAHGVFKWIKKYW